MALDSGRDDFLDLQLFRFVDEFSPEHFLVLQFLASPGDWLDSKGVERPVISLGSLESLLGYSQLPVTGPSLEIVLRDLNDRGLADTHGLGELLTGDAVWQGRVSDLGKELLDFVRKI